MCDLGIALAIGSTVMGAAGQMQQANANAAAAEYNQQATINANKYNQQVANMNAELEERRAKDALERGKLEEQQKRMQVSQLQGKQRAAMAANGVDLSFGSPLDTLVDTATLGELDALNIRSNAYRESYDYRVRAVNTRAGAAMEDYKAQTSADLFGMEAKNSRTAGYLSAGGTILGGIGKAYQGYKNPGSGYFN